MIATLRTSSAQEPQEATTPEQELAAVVENAEEEKLPPGTGPEEAVASETAEASEEAAGELSEASESTENASVQSAEDAQVDAPVSEEEPVSPAPADGEVEAGTAQPMEEDLGEPIEELDLIPLPEDAASDAEFLEDMPTGQFGLPDDLPPMDVAPALPVVPVGESERVISKRYNSLRIKVEKDPALVSLKQKAGEATTFEQSRAAMREFYRLLFSKMRKEDPTLKQRIDAMERAYLTRLSQTRIEPTIPLEPPPKPEPLAP